MNRQIRRAQAKLDKKAEEEKARKKAARRERVATLRQRRDRRREESKAKPARSSETGEKAAVREPGRPLTPQERKKLPGRFSGAFMIATVFFIVLQAAVPVEDKSLQQSLVGAGFFLLFGYFSQLFLSRRGTPNPLTMTSISGVALAAGLLAAAFFSDQQGVDWLLIGVGAVAVVAGAFLGRLVFNAAPR
ncbi:MAG TPA: hypothetical protein VFD39_14960 [Trueperaceae bacterium]|nr:hypothetical protein [Trueperaceae bacterium]